MSGKQFFVNRYAQLGWKFKEAESRQAIRINQTNAKGKKLYDKFFVYIQTDVARDGTFPFKVNERVKVRIDSENRRLIIEKLE
jgi:hypothetical protein